MTLNILRARARLALESAGLLDASRAVRRRMWLAWDPALRRLDRQHRDEFPAFRAKYEPTLADPLNAGRRARGAPALVIGSCCPVLESELAIIKALQLGGYAPTVLVRDSKRGLRPYYELAAVERVHTWGEFADAAASAEQLAERVVAACQRIEDLLAFEHEGVRVGRIALSTAIRQRRVGALDLAPDDRLDLIRRVAFSLSAIAEARKILACTRPGLVVFVDTEYSPTAELFDLCLARGIDAVAYDVGHRTNTLVFKRYTTRNRADHLSTLSDETWAAVQAAELPDEGRADLAHELTHGYASGDWYRACWTQAHTRPVDDVELRRRLGLRPDRKAAFIFPHILWDAPMSWSATLFPTYQDWLLQAVRAACRNTNVDWLIKIHPANDGKSAREGYTDEPAETLVLRTHFPELPSHVRLLDSSFDVSTLSLFNVMDYCLTVRGTVGVEAARLGIPVLAAGAGRYGGKGFTIDSDTVEEYLGRLETIHDIPRLSARQRELAERFAHAFFMLRPLAMTSVTWDYGQLGERVRATIHIENSNDWRHATDISRLSRWLAESSDEDFVPSRWSP